MNIKLNWDALGIVTSIACAIHCALLPVLMSTLPVFGINIIDNVFFEWGKGDDSNDQNGDPLDPAKDYVRIYLNPPAGNPDPPRPPSPPPPESSQ